MIDAWLHTKHSEHERKMKDADVDVQALKAWFRDKVGSDWNHATRNNHASQLGITRGLEPWKEVMQMATQRGHDSNASYVARHARDHTDGFFVWS